MDEEVLAWLETRRAEMLGLLQQFVEHESPSTDKSAVDRLGRRLAGELEASGARVCFIHADQFGNHLLAEVDGEDNDARVLVLGHIDTVWEAGTLERMPFRVQGKRAYGPGAFDMKAGLVQLIFALRVLRETGSPPAARLVALINTDEEVGSLTSRAHIEENARGSRAVLVLEPSLSPRGAVKTFRKGVGSFRLRVTGRAAHAGLDPQGGVSAIAEMARQVLALHAMTNHERGITVNVGTVKGGTRVNVVAAEAEAEVDLRVSSLADAKEMVARIRGLRADFEGAKVKVTGGVDRPPLERSAGVVSLYEKAKRLAGELGFELEEGGAGGASDGNFTAALGVATLDGLGAVGDGAHARHEHVLIDEMPRRAALLACLLREL